MTKFDLMPTCATKVIQVIHKHCYKMILQNVKKFAIQSQACLKARDMPEANMFTSFWKTATVKVLKTSVSIFNMWSNKTWILSHNVKGVQLYFLFWCWTVRRVEPGLCLIADTDTDSWTAEL